MDRSGVVVLLVRAEDAERAVAAVKAALADAPPPRLPKNGERLGTFTAEALDALPVGSAFGLSYGPLLVKTASGWTCGVDTFATSWDVVRSDLSNDRTLVLPAAAPPKRTPKDGDTLGSFSAAELADLPMGSKFVHPTNGYGDITRVSEGRWSKGPPSVGWDSSAMLAANAGFRTLVLPRPAAPTLPAVGTLLSNVTDAQLDVLPVGSRFEDPSDAAANCLDSYALVKEAGRWYAGRTRSRTEDMGEWRREYGHKYRLVRIGTADAPGRVTVPSASAPTPKPLDFGTRLSATTDADLDALPVGSRFEDWEPVLGLSHAPIVKTTAGWRLDVPNATPMSSAWWRGEFGGHRLARRGWLNTPNPGRDGDRLGSFAPADLDALPVWAAFTSGASVIRKQSSGRWLNGPRVGIGDARWLLCNGDPNRTLTLPRSTK